MTTITRNMKKAYICDCITAGMVLFSVMWMFSGIVIGHGRVLLTASRWGILRYYTVDSNILMGIAAALSAHSRRAVLNGRRKELPAYVPALKLIGVVGVTLTMLVTMFFLAPTMAGGYRALFSNSNFFLHLLNPLMSLYGFLGPERGICVRRREALYGVSSVAVYAVYYAANCALHAVGDVVPRQVDWYGFAVAGLRRGCLLVLPLLLLCAYAISLGLWALNRGKK